VATERLVKNCVLRYQARKTNLSADRQQQQQQVAGLFIFTIICTFLCVLIKTKGLSRF
jgi:hypothetical protein